MGFFPKGEVPDSDYLLGRAEMESRIADATGSQSAADAHHALASAYLDRLFSEQPGDGTLDQRMRIGRENRLAMLSVFAHMPAQPPLPANQPDDEFDALLRKLA